MCIFPHQCSYRNIVTILVYFFKEEIVLYILFLKYCFYFEITFVGQMNCKDITEKSFMPLPLFPNAKLLHDCGLFMKTNH